MFLILIINLAFAAEVKTVNDVDFTKYQGIWYEVASIPADFQASCVKNTSAEYTLNQDGTVKVKNSCVEAGGTLNVANGLARINPEFNSPGKLEVTFVKALDWVWAAAGDYWILQIGEDYSYVLVGHPQRTYGWILVRDQKQSKVFYQHASQVFADRGYDTCQILLSNTDQQNFEERPRLCDFVK